MRRIMYCVLFAMFALSSCSLTPAEGGTERSGGNIAANAFSDKAVGILYETWFNSLNKYGAPPSYPDYIPDNTYRYWGTPALGKYKSDNTSVINTHASQLAAAGVDYIVIDYSNNNITDGDLHSPLFILLNEYTKRLQNGQPYPKITFLINSVESQLNKLYNEVYLKYDSRLFFYMDGKPLLLPMEQCSYSVLSHFTVRFCWGLLSANDNRWSFMQPSPQKIYYNNGQPEQIAVSAAQQETWMSLPSAHGRKYNYRTGRNDGYDGQNFDDQWQIAINSGAKHVFIKAWNEWESIGPAYVDEYNPLFSNDIEPMSGGHGDFYYQKMKSWISQFKGPVQPDPSIGNGGGLYGEYYTGTAFNNIKMTRVDSKVSFDWASGSPDASVPSDSFTVRWSGTVQAKYDGSWSFYTTSDDGVRLWVNGQLLIDDWTLHGPTERSAAISLTAGTRVDIKMEYYENGGGAMARLSWSHAYQAKEVIPQSQLYSVVVKQPDAVSFASGYYKITGKQSGKCLDVSEISQSNGAQIWQWDYVGGLNQQWQIVSTGNSWYKIIARHSGKALDVNGGSANNGAKIQQYTDLNNSAQQWGFVDTGAGYYSIVNKNSLKCLDVVGMSLVNGTNIQQWELWGGDNQKFKIEKVADIAQSSSSTSSLSSAVVSSSSKAQVSSSASSQKPVSGLKAQAFNGSTTVSGNQIYPRIQLVNTGTTSVALSAVKVRYYYTKDGSQAQSFWCDWSPVGSANVTGAFISVNPAKATADTYLEIGFTSAAGSINPGQSIDVQCRTAKSDWSNYNQSNDYSFNPTGSSYSDWQKTPVYVNGALAWGIEP